MMFSKYAQYALRDSVVECMTGLLIFVFGVWSWVVL